MPSFVLLFAAKDLLCCTFIVVDFSIIVQLFMYFFHAPEEAVLRNKIVIVIVFVTWFTIKHYWSAVICM